LPYGATARGVAYCEIRNDWRWHFQPDRSV
jgi:hypothetical protein